MSLLLFVAAHSQYEKKKFEHTDSEVISVIDFYSPGFPNTFGPFFNSTNLQNEFLSLPEDAQQAILKTDIHSEEELHNCIQQYKRKA